jgi:hypothetical protein
MRTLSIAVVLALIAPIAVAQRGGAGAGHASGFGHSSGPGHAPASSLSPSRSPGHESTFGHGFGDFRRSSPYLSPYASLPFPFFGDAFDPDDLYSTGYPVASEPPPYVQQAASEMASRGASFMGSSGPSEGRNSAPSQPLLIELQNGRYVRVGTTAIDGEAHDLTATEDSERTASARNSNRLLAANSSGPLVASSSPASDLPSVTLFFRDGHSEEVRDYTIADGILYASGDYYTDGYWNKKINLSALDLARTLQSNAANHVNFVLPSSPNEVITRP